MIRGKNQITLEEHLTFKFIYLLGSCKNSTFNISLEDIYRKNITVSSKKSELRIYW
jgi:hypothetical protein